ncbi:MAG: rhomboid family intramembrane serine protease [Candidatus Bathyarchaeia archaeon]
MLMHKVDKKFMLTYLLITANILVYIYTSIVGGDLIYTNDNLLIIYGQSNWLVMRGWYWQLFTAMFIHVNIVHLLGNMFFLLIFGLRAEELFSLTEYAAVYFISGLAGNLLTLLLGPYIVSAGASGAIFGLFGACAIYVRQTIGQSIISVLFYAFFLLMVSSGPNINFLAHFGGLVAGLLVGYVIAARRVSKIKYRYSVNYG